MLRIILIPLILTTLSGCYTAKHSVDSQAVESALQLSKESTIYVSIPADGQFETKVYPNSGMMTATAFHSALVKNANKVVVGKKYEDQDQALISARSASANYLLVPIILHWEDRATEWSGKPDRLEFTAIVIEVSTGQELDRAVLKGSSSWFTMGGDHPQDMLAGPIGEYVSSLFE